jgi:curved DNA-binding protein CbpA
MSERDWQAETRRMALRESTARAILRVGDLADAAEVRRAFRALALESHPDRNPGDPDARRRFHLLNTAYRFLIEGTGGEELDRLDPDRSHDARGSGDGARADGPDGRHKRKPGGRYDLDHPSGYFAWWRETFE